MIRIYFSHKSFFTTETLTSYQSVTNGEFLSDTFAITSNIDDETLWYW